MPLQRDEGYSEPPQPAPATPPPPPDRTVPLGTEPGLTEIHTDQVETAAKLFEDSAKDLAKLLNDAQRRLRMTPMASDEVSCRAATEFTKAGIEGPNSHVAAMTAYQYWLQDIAAGIRASAARYRLTDEAKAAEMRRLAGG